LVEFKTGSSANGMMSEVQPPITSRPSFHSHRARLIHLLGDNLRTSSTTPKFSNAADRLVNKKQLIRSVNKCRTVCPVLLYGFNGWFTLGHFFKL